jgi:hypothetical protein
MKMDFNRGSCIQPNVDKHFFRGFKGEPSFSDGLRDGFLVWMSIRERYSTYVRK